MLRTRSTSFCNEPEILLAAASREQAGNVALEHAKSLIRSSETLAGLLVVKRAEIVVPETNGVLRTVSTGGAAFGGSPSVACVDEMWLFDRDAQEEMWQGIQTGLAKVPDGYALVTSTAPTHDETLLGRLLEAELLKPDVEQPHDALRIVRDRTGGVFTTWYGAVDPACDVDDEGLWGRVNPASWVDVEALRKRRHAPGISDQTFRKLHLNAPGREAEDGLITAEQWRACVVHGLEPGPDDRVIVGVDRSREGDCAAVGWCWRIDEDHVGVGAHVWATSKRLPAHEYPPFSRVATEPVEAFISELCDRYRVAKVVLDDRRIRRFEVPVPVAKVRNGGREQRRAADDFHSLILDGLLRHDGDSVVERSMLSLDGQPDAEGVRIYPRDGSRADCAYAIVNSLSELGGESVYATRGATVIDTGPEPLPIWERDVASFHDSGIAMVSPAAGFTLIT